MYIVDMYLRVRRACLVEGMSIREASRVFGLHRDTVRKMLSHPVPPGYRRKRPPHRPKLEPYTGVIDRILEDDLSTPKKQRHTAKRIFERLKKELWFDGGYTIVKDYSCQVARHIMLTLNLYIRRRQGMRYQAHFAHLLEHMVSKQPYKCELGCPVEFNEQAGLWVLPLSNSEYPGPSPSVLLKAMDKMGFVVNVPLLQADSYYPTALGIDFFKQNRHPKWHWTCRNWFPVVIAVAAIIAPFVPYLFPLAIKWGRQFLQMALH